MSLLGSTFGRALAGGAKAGAGIAAKYIDDEIARNRAQAIADIQRANASGMRQDADAFTQGNRARDMAQERETALSRGTTAQEVELSRLNNDQLYNRAREIKAGDISAEAAARRTADTETMNDAGYQGAKRATADADADAEIKRKLKAGEALLPQEVNRARQLAEATYSTAAKYRDKGSEPQTLAGKMDSVEQAIGRKLTQQERERFAGLGKSDDGIDKWVRELVGEEVKAGTITADRAPERLQAVRGAFVAVEQSNEIARVVVEARREGKASEAAKELIQRGFDGDQLKRWFSPEEIKAAQAVEKPATRPRVPAERGNIQLLQPLYDLGNVRRRLQEQSLGQ
jgi:hypothetical protein